MSDKPMIGICMPGGSFPVEWVANWMNMLPQMLHKYNITTAFGYSNNIYFVRNKVLGILEPVLDELDYVLWIDSDNLPTFQGLELLMEAIQRPDTDAVGGWYWIHDGPNGLVPSAGFQMWGVDSRLLPDEIELAKDLIQVDWMGFGFLLMKTGLVKSMGKSPFKAGFYPNGELMADDAGFCLDAKAKGFKFYVHPKVYVPHLKLVALGENHVDAKKSQ